MARSGTVRWLLAPVALVAGAVTGLASVAVHQAAWGWWGLAVAAPLAAALALPAGWLRCAFVVGWVVVLGRGAVPRPEGDYLVSGSPAGYALLGSGLGLVCLAAATLPVGGRAERHGPAESDPPGPGT